MAYQDNFQLADDLIAHLSPIVGSISDPFLASRYVGFVSVSAATVYELAIKEIFCSFADAKHSVLGHFTRSHFERLNGRIKYVSLHKEHVARFGDKYVRRFKQAVAKRETLVLRASGKSVINSYGNVIVWRHQFAHRGQVPTNPTFLEVIDAYQIGKEVIDCLAGAMRR